MVNGSSIAICCPDICHAFSTRLSTNNTNMPNAVVEISFLKFISLTGMRFKVERKVFFPVADQVVGIIKLYPAGSGVERIQLPFELLATQWKCAAATQEEDQLRVGNIREHINATPECNMRHQRATGRHTNFVRYLIQQMMHAFYIKVILVMPRIVERNGL